MADQGKEIHQKECCKFGVLFWLFNLLLFSFSLSSLSWLPELAGSVITQKILDMGRFLAISFMN